MVLRLALALEAGTPRSGSTVLHLDRGAAEAAASAGGATVLLYQLVSDTFVMFRGTGRVAALEYDTDGSLVLCRIDQYRPFATPVLAEPEARMSRVQLLLWLSVERADAILAEGDASSVPPSFEEAPADFNPDETYAAIESEVLDRWDYRCSVTGERHKAGSEPSLFVVPIRPRLLGGPLHARNFLPMVETAARAWTFGHISAGPQLDFIAVLDALEADLLERMRREGKLLVPRQPDLGPDPEHLEYHRTFVFAH